MKVDLALSNFSQSDDRRFVLRVDQRGSAFHELARSMRGEHYQCKSVFFFFQTIFDCNSSH